MRSLPTRTFARLIAGYGMLLAASHSIAEDIDIFVGSPANTDLPNVIIMLDNSANWSAQMNDSDGVNPHCHYRELVNGTWVDTGIGPKASNPNSEVSTKLAVEKCALHDAIEALPVAADGSAAFNVGLMLFNGSTGAYPRVSLQPLTLTHKTRLKETVKNLGINDDKFNNGVFATALYEASLYLNAKAVYKGKEVLPPKRDDTAFAGDRYNPPATNNCGKNFIILIGNGSPQENNPAVRDLLTVVGMPATQFTWPTSGTDKISTNDSNNWSDEWASYMYTHGTPGKITTFTISVLAGISSDGNFFNYMKAIATKGGSTGRKADSVEHLIDAVGEVFGQIQSVSSVFASATLPISVNTRGTYLNQVFMGMFIPDRDLSPRWYGNLKQYQFKYDPDLDTLSLVDQDNDDAISATTGFIAPSARSFWTESSTFWVNDQMGTPVSESDDPDGEVVPKGAAAQMLRQSLLTSQGDRAVYTCVNCATNTVLSDTASATKFVSNNSSITPASLGVSDDAEKETLINWVRGTDNKAGDEKGPGNGVTVRPSIHGDVLHSRPAAVNYGGDIGVVVFYGANDGMLHAISGNKEETMTIGGKPYAAGATLWSFVPEEVFPKLKRLRDQTPDVHYPNINVLGPDATRRDYFVDGPISIYQKFNSDGSLNKVYLYVGMRRGGRQLYAFDVTTPNAPRFLWKVTNADIPKLGQTWSEARVARVRGNTNPVLIMGGGYDAAAEDADPAGTVTMGNVVLVIDAITGNEVHTFDTERPVPADVSLLDSDFDGFVDRAYAVDLGGHVYRIDFEVGTGLSTEYAPEDWTIRPFADVSASGPKKLFYAPDVVLTKNYTAVMVGSGDREKPLVQTNTDFFFTLIDKKPKGVVAETTDTIRFGDLPVNTEFTSATEDPGCYYELRQGEKVVNAALTIGGNTYFGTNAPEDADSGNTCDARLGVARSYELPLICKTKTSVVLNGGGLPPSPVAGIVTVTYTDNGTTVTRDVPFIIGSGGLASSIAPDAPGDPNDPNNPPDKELSGGSPLGAEKVPALVDPRRKRLYWFNESSH